MEDHCDKNFNISPRKNNSSPRADTIPMSTKIFTFWDTVKEESDNSLNTFPSIELEKVSEIPILSIVDVAQKQRIEIDTIENERSVREIRIFSLSFPLPKVAAPIAKNIQIVLLKKISKVILIEQNAGAIF